MAGIADRTLALKLVADVGDINKSMKGTTNALKKSASAAKSWGKAFAGALVLKGIDTLVGSLDDALKGFKEGEDASRKLSQTWKNLGRDTSQLAGIMGDLGDQALNMGFDDAEVLTAFNTFLTKSGSVKESLQGVTDAMNLARARGIPFSKAVKLVSGSLGENSAELRRNRRQARIWARNHPLEVGLGKITDLWETFVGNFSRGNVNKAFAALGEIGNVVNELLFGKALKGGGRTQGLVDRFVDIGNKIVPAVITGLADLGNQMLLAFNTAIATVDFGKLLGDAVGAGVELVMDNQNVVANLAVVAGFLAAGMFAASIFSTALGAMLGAPAFLASKAVTGAIAVAGTTLLFALRAAMFLAQTSIDAMASGLSFLIASLPLGKDSAIGRAAFGVGTALQALIVAGVSIGLLALLSAILQEALNSLLPGGTRLRFNPETGQMERYEKGTDSASGGMALVGEQGPELVRLPKGSKVWPAGETAAMLGGGGGGGVTINITTGVGDPVEIGRQVDRVLRAYRGRAGLAA